MRLTDIGLYRFLLLSPLHTEMSIVAEFSDRAVSFARLWLDRAPRTLNPPAHEVRVTVRVQFAPRA